MDTPFSQWIRSQPALDSHAGYGVSDIDYSLQKWKLRMPDNTFRYDLKAMLHLEVKTNNAVPFGCQLENLWMLHQRLTQELCTRAFDAYLRPRFLFHFGVAFLRLMYDRPDDGGLIRWGRFDETGEILWHLVTQDQLLRLLAFDAMPDEPSQQLKPEFFDDHANKINWTTKPTGKSQASSQSLMAS